MKFWAMTFWTHRGGVLISSLPLNAALFIFAMSLAACGDDPPAWCTSTGEPTVTCAGPQCVLGLVVDYKRLEPRGYRVFALDGQAINRQEGEVIARRYVEETLKGPTGGVIDCERDEDFLHCVLNYDATQDRYLLVLHGVTGRVLYAGFERWADPDKRGYDFPLPEGFSDAKTIGCAGPAAAPERQRLVFLNTGPLPNGLASTARQALDVARRTNAVVNFVAGSAYRAVVINSSPAIGGLDNESTDWLVWIYRLSS